MPGIGRVLMVRGRDAADVAMITSFGAYDLELFSVWTEEIAGQRSQEALLTRPGPARQPPRGRGADAGAGLTVIGRLIEISPDRPGEV